MLALADRGRDPSAAVLKVSRDMPVVLSLLTEVTLLRLGDLSADAQLKVSHEASKRQSRWLGATRRALLTGEAVSRQASARLLAEIGEREDVQRLRDVGRSSRDRSIARLGLDLARRVASRVVVHDLGRVQIVVGSRAVEGHDVRRKVLCAPLSLVSKPRFASTREEVVDCLWPDLDPASALNSLNQTVYFLRRVFEPDYREDTSPGYVRQDGETIWLDLGPSRRAEPPMPRTHSSDAGRPDAEVALRSPTSTAAGSRSTSHTRSGRLAYRDGYTPRTCGSSSVRSGSTSIADILAAGRSWPSAPPRSTRLRGDPGRA